MTQIHNEYASTIELNIMPLLDIFSILILFLLMSFSTDPLQVDLDDKLELPQSIVTAALDEVPTVIVNKETILVNGDRVVALFDGEPVSGKSQGAIMPLYKALSDVAETNRRILAKMAPTMPQKLPVLTLEIDKTHSFRLIKRILLSAQQADFIEFKLMVAKEP
jgi:biopolymer transport protein ExbD